MMFLSPAPCTVHPRGFEIHDFGIFLGKNILANIFLASLILVGIFGGTKIYSKNIVTVFSAMDM